MNPEQKTIETEKNSPRNLLTHPEETIEAMAKVEGEAWLNDQKRSLAKKDLDTTVYRALEKLKEAGDLSSEEEPFSIAEVYGGGGTSRWYVMTDGTVRFSPFHDKVEPHSKTQKAQELGFEMQK